MTTLSRGPKDSQPVNKARREAAIPPDLPRPPPPLLLPLLIVPTVLVVRRHRPRLLPLKRVETAHSQARPLHKTLFLPLPTLLRPRPCPNPKSARRGVAILLPSIVNSLIPPLRLVPTTHKALPRQFPLRRRPRTLLAPLLPLRLVLPLNVLRIVLVAVATIILTWRWQEMATRKAVVAANSAMKLNSSRKRSPPLAPRPS